MEWTVDPQDAKLKVYALDRAGVKSKAMDGRIMPARAEVSLGETKDCKIPGISGKYVLSVIEGSGENSTAVATITHASQVRKLPLTDQVLSIRITNETGEKVLGIAMFGPTVRIKTTTRRPFRQEINF